MRFLIIDDDLKFAESLQTRLSQEFTTAITIDISNSYSTTMPKYDIYFLDIDMPGQDGIAIANKIREEDKQAIIVFVSYREDLIFESLEVIPLQFIRKNNLESDLEIVIKNIKTVLEENIFTLELPIVRGVPRTLLLRNIRYFEKSGTDVIIHTINRDYRVRATVSQYAENLPKEMFGSISQSYLVNFRYVESMELDHVVMKAGEILYFSRGRKKLFKERYINYLGSHKL